MKTICLHIGTHKTGSTSIQEFISQNSHYLRTRGIRSYNSLHGTPNHIEIYLSAQRYERDSFQKLKMSTIFNQKYTDTVRRYFDEFLSTTADCDKVAISAEGLSLLIYKDEIDRLHDIISAQSNDVRVILYLRNKVEFLRSYRAQILKMPGRMPSNDRNSALCVEPNSLLVDYDAIKSAFEYGFPGKLTVVDYDVEKSERGSILPSYLEFLGLNATEFDNLSKFFYNTTL